MNAVGGIVDASQDGLTIIVEVADGRVCAARISSTRRTDLSRLFVGRPADEAPLLAERIFALCGAAHRVVAARAIASARGEPVPAQRNRSDAIALAAERLGASLRSNMILALQRESKSADLELVRPLGELLSLLRDLCAQSFARAPGAAEAARLLIVRIRASGHALGLAAEGAEPAYPLAFRQLEKEFAASEPLAITAPDSLGDADDLEIMQRARAAGASFAVAPSLEGRAPETGAFARRWAETDFSKGALAARFQARMIDIAECLSELEGAERDFPAACHAFSPALREGFAAAETSRGRLCHWVRLSVDGRIADHQIVAPTEWNFHPTGPFIETLLGASMSRGCAERRIVQLASLFDPCAPFRVEVREHGHA
ncbi:nickel-dependent hydrogenase large subunit [Methylocystis bryophila]|uniref:Hydrogenase n=1 Tax=Methylocystis bryophila TaxID=655015 RepID=A0A1W6MW81_9HYPH|nr:nickel-dependent hydrogenase large subunit [Methylocystis bryophila]ARN81858.1 hypothetical protein B1812_13060 [Methylocystis bryophila]BDV37934.1 hydrogenase expression/formation protein HupK [Methylocystis bryophila]